MDQQIYMLENYSSNGDLTTNRSTYSKQFNGTKYPENDYYQIAEFDNQANTTSLPSLDKPKFKPTNATQYIKIFSLFEINFYF